MFVSKLKIENIFGIISKIIKSDQIKCIHEGVGLVY